MAGDEGSLDEEIIRKLMELRTYLDSRIKQLEDEQEKLKTLFKIVDEVIVSKSFRIAETTQQPRPEPAPKAVMHPSAQAAPTHVEAIVQSGEEIPLKTQNGVLLANMYVDETDIHIIPDKEKVLQLSTPPFQSFLVGRILESMRLKDQEDVKTGALAPNLAFEYEVIKEEDIIREIVIRNYGNQRRMREIMTTTRWTLEKMNEKAATPT